MVSKYLGIVLMLVGVMMAWGSLGPLLTNIVVVVWQVFKLSLMLFVAYVGYRLWRQRYLSGA
ncbi:MAG: hypothetical protein ACI8V2_001658 [Candidatus Latescibacterota bacterium]|jgi:hypothetical protein